jgi:hypothetical protein
MRLKRHERQNWTGRNWKSVQCARTSQSITLYTRIATSAVIPHAHAKRSAICARLSSFKSLLTAPAGCMVVARTYLYLNFGAAI